MEAAVVLAGTQDRWPQFCAAAASFRAAHGGETVAEEARCTIKRGTTVLLTKDVPKGTLGMSVLQDVSQV
eukprot:7413046-Alexandrium_andersonii.AAC.1